MKANQKFANADEAVSPVIGVILMVAITVVLAAVVFVLVNNLTGDSGDKAPVAKLEASADSGTVAKDILIKHLSGDTLTASEFQVSVTPDGSNPVYETCVTGANTQNFEAGFQLRATFVTDGDGAADVDCDITTGFITDDASTPAGTALAAGDYQVAVRHVASGAVLLNTVVTIL